MPHSLAKVIIHIVFSTKNRRPIIPMDRLQELHAYMATVCQKQGAQVFQIGGVQDHIHIACTLPRTVAIAKFVQAIKRSSSRWLEEKCQTPFQWQNGYGVFSISTSHLLPLIHYIRNQRNHHAKRGYSEEHQQLCLRNTVERDNDTLEDGMNIPSLHG